MVNNWFTKLVSVVLIFLVANGSAFCQTATAAPKATPAPIPTIVPYIEPVRNQPITPLVPIFFTLGLASSVAGVTYTAIAIPNKSSDTYQFHWQFWGGIGAALFGGVLMLIGFSIGNGDLDYIKKSPPDRNETTKASSSPNPQATPTPLPSPTALVKPAPTALVTPTPN